MFAAQVYWDRLLWKELAQPVGPAYWSLDSAGEEQAVGAFYSPADNSINIMAGILRQPFYYAQGGIEQRYFAVGIVIGHELTHGFHPNGSYFDKNGNLADWWEPEDRASFEALQKPILEYFGSIEVMPGQFLDSDNCIGEIVADIGGVSLMLEVMSGMEDVDYQLVFTTYADMWHELVTAETAGELLQTDEHPPKYVRVNGVVQQFEEFHQAFGTQERDGMYLPPEERVGLW